MIPTHGLSDASINYLREHGIEVLFRIKNNAVEYSMTDKPDPIVTGLSDQKIAVCLVHAGREFRSIKVPKIDASKRKEAMRMDGDTIVYDEAIRIDWNEGTISSSRGKDMTLRILSIVVQNLMSNAPPDGGDAPN